MEVEVVSENREKLKAPVFLPSKAAVVACQDKLESAKVWRKKNVPVARTMEVRKDRTSTKLSRSLAAPFGLGHDMGQAGKAAPPPITGKLQSSG